MADFHGVIIDCDRAANGAILAIRAAFGLRQFIGFFGGFVGVLKRDNLFTDQTWEVDKEFRSRALFGRKENPTIVAFGNRLGDCKAKTCATSRARVTHIRLRELVENRATRGCRNTAPKVADRNPQTPAVDQEGHDDFTCVVREFNRVVDHILQELNQTCAFAKSEHAVFVFLQIVAH